MKKLKSLNYVLNYTDYYKHKKIVDTVMNECYSELRNQIEADEMIMLIKNSDFFDLLILSMNNICDDMLYNSFIHGKNHVERVCILSYALCILRNLSYDDINLCLYAAKYHDIGRRNDGQDPEHGMRGADLFERMNVPIDETSKMIVSAVIYEHSLDNIDETGRYKEIFEETEKYNRFLLILNILKDADALDRFRLYKSSLNIDFLRLEESRLMVKAACMLYCVYENIC